MPAIESVVTSVTNVNWGLWMFASVDDVCGVTATPDVAPTTAPAAQITTTLNATQAASSSTPTTAALQAAIAYYKGLNDGHGHFLLLATDGMPTCNGGILVDGDDSAAAEAAVTAANTAGIKTFVVGIGDRHGRRRGADADGDQRRRAGHLVGLADLLSRSIRRRTSRPCCRRPPARSCRARTTLTVAPTDPTLVSIDDNNGNKIPHDPTHMDGWDFGPNNLSIVFYGAACTSLQSGVTSSISAVYGCPGIS